MKRRFSILVLFVLVVSMLPLIHSQAADTVNLTLGSWRTDDSAQWKVILDAFNKKYPNITVKFDPTNPPDYNATLQTQLQTGNAPDLFFLRSFSTSLAQYKAGYLESLADLPDIKTAFSDASRVPWSATDGTPYGIPLIAVSHGVYYNQDVFKKLNLTVPTTWKDFLATAQKIKDAGIIPLANGSGDEWTIAEVVFMNLAPTFIGGRDGRIAYLKGDRCFNDANSVSAFQAIADITPFLPKGQEALKETDTQQLFLQGQAAMLLEGSWNVPFFESQKPDFNWSVFAIPAPEGKKSVVTFHLDAGMGLNSKSAHKAEAKQFLQWLETADFATLFANQLPGFFPMLEGAKLSLNNPHADAFLKLNDGRTTDIRWAWEGLLDGKPDGYSLMQDNALAIIAGKETAQQAADALQTGLAQWFAPAKTCKK